MFADRASLFLWGAAAVTRYGRPDVALGFLGGIGDDLLCTAPIEEWLGRGARRVWFFTRHPELYPHFDRRVQLLPEDPRLLRLATRLGRSMRPLGYSRYDDETDRDDPAPEHIIAAMCRRAGVTGRVRLRPHLRLTAGELAHAAAWEGCVAVQSSGLHARVPMQNKQWFAARMQAVVDHFAGRLRFVQIGSPTDPALRGTTDLRPSSTLRGTASVLARARLFVGTVGFPMHLARAVECPAVIVYGGRELPEITGYACNENVIHHPPCAPCWQRNRCDHEHRCMDAISAAQVIAAVEAALSRPRHPLAEAAVDLGLPTASV